MKKENKMKQLFEKRDQIIKQLESIEITQLYKQREKENIEKMIVGMVK